MLQLAKLIFILVAGCIYSSLSVAQSGNKVMEVPKSAADCMGAIRIVDEIGPIKNTVGAGFFYEMKQSYESYPFLMLREFNPCWFKFSVEKEGELDLIIKSINPGDNYNFALYLSPGPWFCNTFQSEQMGNPVRANCSLADVGIGYTGLSADGLDSLATSETAEAFCKPFKTRQGDSFYLFVDSESRPQSGYTIEIKVRELSNE